MLDDIIDIIVIGFFSILGAIGAIGLFLVMSLLTPWPWIALIVYILV